MKMNNDLTALWQTQDPNTTQLNWDGMYNANYKNLFTQLKRGWKSRFFSYWKSF